MSRSKFIRMIVVPVALASIKETRLSPPRSRNYEHSPGQ